MGPKYLWMLIPVAGVVLTACIVPSIRKPAASHGATGVQARQAETEADWQNIQAKLSQFVETGNQQNPDAANKRGPKQEDSEQAGDLEQQAKAGTAARSRQQEELQRRVDYDLKETNDYALREQQAIETWYAREYTSLSKDADRRRQLLNTEERLAQIRYRRGTPEYSAAIHRIEQERRDIDRWPTALAQKKAEKSARVNAEVQRRKKNIAWYKAHEEREAQRKLSGLAGPQVEGIAYEGDGRSYAVVDGAIVHEGETVSGYKVRKIHAESVEFEKDGQITVRNLD